MSSAWRGLLAPVLFCSALACSSKSAAPTDSGIDGLPATEVTGTIGGAAFRARDAIFSVAAAKGLGFNGRSTVVLVSDFGGACPNQGTNTGVKGGQSVFLGLATNDAAGMAAPITGPGVFVVGPGSAAQMPGGRAQLFHERDGDDCLKAESHSASSGQVTIVSLSTSTVSGTFDVVLTDTNERVTGSFLAASCASFDPNRTPNATCM
ncbi:MAG: hypothetical protein JWM82_4437 [Myxococcales bacterium]|nr:hypothetical protein [Myxococcales bacterium]